MKKTIISRNGSGGVAVAPRGNQASRLSYNLLRQITLASLINWKAIRETIRGIEQGMGLARPVTLGDIWDTSARDLRDEKGLRSVQISIVVRIMRALGETDGDFPLGFIQHPQEGKSLGDRWTREDEQALAERVRHLGQLTKQAIEQSGSSEEDAWGPIFVELWNKNGGHRSDTAEEAPRDLGTISDAEEKAEPAPAIEEPAVAAEEATAKIGDDEPETLEEELEKDEGGQVMRLPIKLVRPYAEQPRKRFAGIADLASSIQTEGQRDPVWVKKLEGDPVYKYELITGGRRHRAITMIGRTFIRAVIKKPTDEAEQYEMSVRENCQRNSLDALETAEAIHKLRKEFGRTWESISTTFGKSVPTVKVKERLAFLHPEIKRRILSDGPDHISIPTASGLADLDHQGQLEALNDPSMKSSGPKQAQRVAEIVARVARDNRSRLRTGRNVSRPSAHENFSSLRCNVTTSCAKLEHWAEMSSRQIETIFLSRPLGEVQQVMKGLEEISENVRTILGTLRQTKIGQMPKD